jgi:two-component sensor histidine kinase
MRKTLLSLFLLIGFLTAINAADTSTVSKVERFIFLNELDSAQQLISKIEQNEYADLLLRVITNQKLSYKEQLTFISSAQSRTKVNDAGLQEYLKKGLITPSKQSEIDLDYVELRFIQVSSLRNGNKISQANSLNNGLEDYIESFGTNTEEVKRAKLYYLIHGQVVAMIQNKGMQSEQLGLEILRKAQKLKDTTFIIAANFHLYNTYSKLNNTERAIEVTRRAIALDEMRVNKSVYYYDNLLHLAVVLMHTEGVTAEVKGAVKIIYENERWRPRSYELIARGIWVSKEDKESIDFMLSLAQENTVVDFAERAIRETEGIIYDYELYYLYNACAYMLRSCEEYDMAMGYLSKGVQITRKVFSEDLSKSLADYERKQIRIEKELEVAHAEENGIPYRLIVALSAILVILLVIALMRKLKKSNLLTKKNEQINKALGENKLLLKEMHHRVKNNFLTVSSLLELQSKDIEDIKAKELAEEGQNRVKSMALIHEKLYKSDSFGIDFDKYVRELVLEITKSYGKQKATKISYEMDENLTFDADTAIPSGLIVNELITNAFKHGGPQDQTEVYIQVRRIDNDFHELIVQDNGKGLPTDFDLKSSTSMGLRLVKNFSRQLHGEANFKNNSFSVFRVLFKDSAARMLVD